MTWARCLVVLSEIQREKGVQYFVSMGIVKSKDLPVTVHPEADDEQQFTDRVHSITLKSASSAQIRDDDEKSEQKRTSQDKKSMCIVLRSMEGQAMPLNVSSQERVSELKRRLGGEYRRLIFRGKPMEDSSTLSQCGVQDRDTVHAVPVSGSATFTVQVRTVSGKWVALCCEPEDSVRKLKEKIQDALDVDSRHYALLFRGTTLQDGSTLSDSGVHDGAVIHLVMRFRGGEFRQKSKALRANNIFKIKFNMRKVFYKHRRAPKDKIFVSCVDTLLFETFVLELDPSWRVWDVKMLIYHSRGYPAPEYQRLWLYDSDLEESHPLSHYGIQDRCKISLVWLRSPKHDM